MARHRKHTHFKNRAAKGEPGGFFKWPAIFVLGGLIGAVLALLFAPKSGKQTRTQLKNQGAGLVDKVKKAREQQKENQHLTLLSNWGNYPKKQVEFLEFDNIDTLRKLVSESQNVIARGNGRCYGDQALAPQIISCLKYNKFLEFDTENGTIKCQSGVILSELLDVTVPKGWFLTVTPGTKLITVGGAIAADVHGKSQHNTGNFSDHVLEMELMLADGSIVKCSPDEDPEVFWTTCGGMGLTGIILNATLRLKAVETAYFRQESLKARNLDHLMDLFEESEDWPYSVAWIDCLTKGSSMGRGVLMRGEHATVADLVAEEQKNAPLILGPKPKVNVPLSPPDFLLNPLSMKAFNFAYYNKQQAECVKSVVDYNAFFYPLDSILNWNKMYGSRGFTQYQFILPKENSRVGIKDILTRITNSGMTSFLAVLKLYGKQNGYLPFAMDGFSLALDFPIQPGLFEFLDTLDEVVLGYGGRLYSNQRCAYEPGYV